jgi:hypothetical protein
MHSPSLSSLIRRVDEFQQATAIETLARLDTENALLRDLISSYRKNWSYIIDILEEALATLTSLHRALSICICEEIASERAFLEFRGVGGEGDSLPGGLF